MTNVPMVLHSLQRETNPYIVPPSAGPVLRGKDDVSYSCAKCKNTLLQDVTWDDAKGLLVQCGRCQAINAVPAQDTSATGAAPPGALASGLTVDAATPEGSTRRKRISICTPCFNEEENTADVYNAVKMLFEEGGPLANYEREHIFADNASTDSTAEILREIAASDPNVKVIINSRNFGPTRSTYNAILSASGDATLLFLPADMQDPPDMLPQFVRLWEAGYEIVYGIRATRTEGVMMKTVRRAYYRMIASASRIKVPPDVGDYQLIDRKVLAAMRRTHDAFPYIRMMTFEAGFRSIGIKYHWRARRKGMSKNRFFNLVDEGLNGLVTFTSVPLRMCLYAGVLISFAAILYAIATIITSIISGNMAPPGVTTLIVALFFFSGIQLFFLGLIGEYIIAIYGQVREKPMVIERERLNFVLPPKE